MVIIGIGLIILGVVLVMQGSNRGGFGLFGFSRKLHAVLWKRTCDYMITSLIFLFIALALTILIAAGIITVGVPVLLVFGDAIVFGAIIVGIARRTGKKKK